MNGEDGWRETADAPRRALPFLGPLRGREIPGFPPAWRETTRLVASGDWGAIYDLHAPPATPAGLPAMQE
ncbi:MAG: hypothetical protein WDN28_17385 [Chthoniobacter sp.]